MLSATYPQPSCMMRKLALLALLALAGCSTVPDDIDNLCAIFEEEPDWFAATAESEKKWRAPIALQMAILFHESGFVDDARPGWRWFLGVIPLRRKSSAYGYAQALDGTWAHYRSETGNSGADRDDFEDAVDFVGWYMAESRRRLKLRSDDGYRHYLAYHEGQGGYARGSYRGKAWLIRRAHTVDARMRRYGGQLRSCRAQLEG